MRQELLVARATVEALARWQEHMQRRARETAIPTAREVYDYEIALLEHEIEHRQNWVQRLERSA